MGQRFARFCNSKVFKVKQITRLDFVTSSGSLQKMSLSTFFVFFVLDMLINQANIRLAPCFDRRCTISVIIGNSPVRAKQSKAEYEHDFGALFDTHVEHDLD